MLFHIWGRKERTHLADSWVFRSVNSCCPSCERALCWGLKGEEVEGHPAFVAGEIYLGQVRTVYKFIMGASHWETYCSEPQRTVGVPTVPFTSKDIRALENSKGRGRSLNNPNYKTVRTKIVKRSDSAKILTPPSGCRRSPTQLRTAQVTSPSCPSGAGVPIYPFALQRDPQCSG